jgi:isopentenyldiphosphate isomerase
VSADEAVEVVDEGGRVTGVVTRAAMRAGNLRHRAVYVAVVTTDGRLVVHRRAGWKDVWPSRWDLAFGGVLAVGEAWEDAARRELAEEAGIEARLRHAGAGRYEDGEVRVVGEVFVATHDGPFRFADGEVDDVDLVALDALDAWLDGRACCPDTVAIVVPVLRTG